MSEHENETPEPESTSKPSHVAEVLVKGSVVASAAVAGAAVGNILSPALGAVIGGLIGVVAGSATFSALPGRGDPPEGDCYVCPKGCEYRWVRHSLIDEIPNCPTHNVELIKVQSS
jgi:hypothetical protein